MNTTSTTSAAPGRRPPGLGAGRGAVARALRLALVALVASGGPLSATATAPASAATPVNRIEQVNGISDERGSQDVKEASVDCPFGFYVVGGGAFASGSASAVSTVALTELMPTQLDVIIDSAPTGSDVTPSFFVEGSYSATAQEVGAGTTEDWQLRVWAVCASPIRDYEIVVAEPPRDRSFPVTSAVAVCPDGTTALGTGAFVRDAAGNPVRGAALHEVQLSNTGRATSARAHEPVGGFAGNWSVAAVAICGEEPVGYEIVGGSSPQRTSESVKTARATCSAGTRALGLGAALDHNSPAEVALSALYPELGVTAAAVGRETTPTTVDWNRVTTRAVCVDR